MDYFVNKDSIVRSIWGKADTVLFIFAGAAAEFALNKAVDWLYFTGRLPADPLGRLFSTVEYARQILFLPHNQALAAIDKITHIHQGVEKARGEQIPDWAYRDVLFMLIDYSIRSFELLERKMTDAEKQEVFEVFRRVGERMGITGLPQNYVHWTYMRESHLQQDMVKSKYTADLYKKYLQHLGWVRYLLLRQVQVILVPNAVREMLELNTLPLLKPVLWLYKVTRFMKVDWLLKEAILPAGYKLQIRSLDYSF
ncbi:oxygenase MpaB family protein [Mucilaginibacter sp. CSA2-8R]|uniref:oxygenase MpaB family protein n=1 Tax=Mucilaginibacter sp. CSA2-8R TaxID=3141542 RepID=UPI00315CE1E4